jgi:hypothetical protein
MQAKLMLEQIDQMLEEDQEGTTPLHLAAEDGYEVCKISLKFL